MKIPVRFMAKATFFALTLLMLPACDWVKKLSSGCQSCGMHREDSALSKEAVISFGNKVVVNGAEFEKQVSMVFDSQPGVREYINSLPAADQERIYEQILESMVMEKIISNFVERKGINKTAEYKEMAKPALEALERQLMVKAFQDYLQKQVMVDDQDAAKYYEEKKETLPVFQRPEFVKAGGGVRAEGFAVSSEKEAEELAAKAARLPLADVAHGANKKVKNFGLVTQQSNDVDASIRGALSRMANFPSVEVVKVDNKYWVVKGVSKQPSEYAPFEQVQEMVKQVMMQEKFGELYQKLMAEERENNKIVIHKEFLAKRFASAQPSEPMVVEETVVEEVAPEKPQAV